MGSGGYNSPEETEEVLELARTVPNFNGIMLDDFFNARKDGKPTRFSVEELTTIRGRLREMNEEFSIFVTLYTSQCELPIREFLDLVDVITFWTGDPADLVNLESNFEKFERLVPDKRKMLGCYLADFRRKKGVPIPMMKLQCETAQRRNRNEDYQNLAQRYTKRWSSACHVFPGLYSAVGVKSLNR